MPNSTTRRAHRILPATILIGGLTVALASFSALAQNAAPLPPQQITVSFAEHDKFVQRLRQQGVSEQDANAIDRAIRASLTPAQGRAGALVQIDFGGDNWSVQQIAIDPVEGVTRRLDRAAIFPNAPASSDVAGAAPTPTAAPAAAPSVAATTPPPAAPAAAPQPQAVTPQTSTPQATTPSPTIKPVALTATKLPSTTEMRDPFGDMASTTKLAPAGDAIDPEWPVQPPKPVANAKPGHGLTAIHGTLGSDIAASLRNAGAPARIASDIAQAISLHPPLRNARLDGSRFDIAYEPMPDASVGFILAEFTIDNGRQRIWRYRPEGGVTGFYTDEGIRIGGLAVQSPVPGASIVSPYGMRRHPVLKVNKMHWGVDYVANTGTPILAAADGTVADARRLGNYGLYIRVDHDENVATTYGHLSRFETGIRAGTPVKAGQVIGYAGSSGLASGPHLYFEVLVEGKRVDPEQMVSNEPLRLSGADLALFESLKQQATAVQTAAQRQ